MAADASMLHVEVAFALPERQWIIGLEVPAGTSARQAVDLARHEPSFPTLPKETSLETDLGIFGKRLGDPDHQVLREGDRVEIYRPLEIDPKTARAERASR
jgi:putative ubiquitin-RnfH superfamily antitoxin RatB of RatAB toxin-antitoxin module